MTSGMPRSFTRQELYELVWSTPMLKLAKQLDVSDVGLAKACKRAAIPVPGVGYWTKVQHRKPVKQEPLSPLADGIHRTITISPGRGKPTPPEIPYEVAQEIARESSAERKTTVPNALSNPHRVVKAWIESEKHRPSPYGAYVPPRQRDPIESRRRRLLTALFKALEKRGHGVIVDPEHLHQVTLQIRGERIEFRLTQRQRQVEEALTPQRRPTSSTRSR